ncbi:MAG: dTMP kinase [Methanomassiliicoccales archaeon]|jgi:dTMP kinase
MAEEEEEPVATAENAAASARALFVVFEGIDGSGKSTVARGVYDALSREMPGRVMLTAEPTDSWLGDCVRRANAEGTDEFAEALLFVADRAQHGLLIKTWLEQGMIVISDRYFSSTLAYQGALLKSQIGGTKAALEWLREVNRPIIVPPDLTLLLTVKVNTAVDRLASRGKKTKFEDLDYLHDVDLIYRGLAMEDPSFFTLDASKPEGEVIKQALRAIRNKL